MLKIHTYLAMNDALYTIGNCGNQTWMTSQNYEMCIDLEQIFSALQSLISVGLTSINC